MTEEDNIHKLFRDVFENLEVSPPVSVKMEIDKQLGPKKRIRFIFWWFPVLVLLLAGLAFAVVNYQSDVRSSKQPAVASNSNSTEFDSGEPAAESDEVSSRDAGAANPGQSGVIESAPTEKEVKSESKGNTDHKIQETRKLQRGKFKKGNSTPALQNENPKSATTNNDGLNKNPKPSAAADHSGSNGKTGPAKSKNKQRFKTKKSTKKGNNGREGATNTPGPVKESSKETNQTSGDPKQTPDPQKTDVSDSKEKPEVVAAKAGEKDLQPKEKVDSIQKADSLASTVQTDSVVKPVQEPEKVKPPKDDSKARNWMIEVYGGPRFGAKTSKSDFALKESNAYLIGLGFSRRLDLGPLKYVTLDGEYGSGKEAYSTQTSTDSVYYVGIDSIPELDSLGNIIGYSYYNNFDTLTNTLENKSNSAVTRFAFGLRTQLNFDLGGGFGLAVMPGYYYSMSKYKFSDGTNSSSSSSQILLGLGVYYDWNRFRFRIGLDTRYELMRKNQNTFIDRRRTMLFTPQFGIAVKF